MRISLRTKVVASYIGIIVLTVATVLILHDQFVFSQAHPEEETLNHLTTVSRVLTQAYREGWSQERLAQGFVDCDRLTPFRTVLTSTPPAFPYSVTLADFRFSAREVSQLAAGQVLVGRLTGRLPGVRGTFGAARIQGADLVTYHVYPRGIADWYQTMARSVLRGCLVAVLLGLLAALPLAANLTAPLRRLEKVARRFAAGNLDERANLGRGDEIGTLSEAFDEMADSLQHNLETRTRLLNDVSHELATPVTTLRATLEALLDGLVEPDQQKRYLASLLNQVEQLSYLLNDITELARFESGQVGLEVSSFPPAEPLEGAAAPLRLLGRPLELEVEGVADLQVRGDARRIQQVLQNLLNNAFEHNPEGTQVRLTCHRCQDRVNFCVCDDGPPIPDGELERIFERFYKVDSARSRQRRGGGLGLSIVRQILEAHGTTIRVEAGKCFCFSLPINS